MARHTYRLPQRHLPGIASLLQQFPAASHESISCLIVMICTGGFLALTTLHLSGIVSWSQALSVLGLSSYVEAFERESITHGLTGVARWTRRTRYWLCTGAFAAIEGNDTLTFEHTLLLILAERLPDRGDMAPRPASPCASHGTDDPLAAEFAHWLTEHLHEVGQVVPVTEIEDFACIMASVTWLMDQDPYRDVRPWLHTPLARAETPATVPTLARQAMREQTVHQNGRLVSSQYRLEVSGGVVMAPVLQRFRVGDNSLRLLHRTVLAARPTDRPAMWHFTFSPPST